MNEIRLNENVEFQKIFEFRMKYFIAAFTSTPIFTSSATSTSWYVDAFALLGAKNVTNQTRGYKFRKYSIYVSSNFVINFSETREEKLKIDLMGKCKEYCNIFFPQ